MKGKKMKLTKRGQVVVTMLAVLAGLSVMTAAAAVGGDEYDGWYEPPTADHEDNQTVVTIEPWLMDPPTDTVPPAEPYQPPPEAQTSSTQVVKACE